MLHRGIPSPRWRPFGSVWARTSDANGDWPYSHRHTFTFRDLGHRHNTSRHLWMGAASSLLPPGIHRSFGVVMALSSSVED